ncbi:MAG: radical SAM protein [Anaerocolumna sp.]
MNKHLLEDCTLCPRNCHVDRTQGQIGKCSETDELVVARAALHMWEEPCISGEKGSGTVFFSGCAMGCVFCQNKNIAKGLTGRKITIERLAGIFMELQDKGANNINLVTPSHYVPQIIDAVKSARRKGLHLPIVYNSSGYEKVETIKLLKDSVDIYLPDFKYKAGKIGEKYSNTDNYFQYASEAIKEMVRQTGEPVFNEGGMMTKGVIVRHLTLPGYLKDSKDILEYLYKTFGDKIYISIMNQYTPLSWVEQYPEINRKITAAEYDELVQYALYLGVENGFIQEGETASGSFIPEFNEEGV